ncbi:Alpha/Beta hydrolase protein [Lipomyces tetrasporus]|uniref:Alpha/Beta hydrolase protein n=1 Tax=Lipomyces tetrasporus TaxID=54092 RepID=A0AAD7QW20_9ASCO|nr:Alpha/Beta hydrolase protein [Lipomyces tetrasporus]KAJ8101931.1 Alpha/Beta hydrolase protein [Lipomyces tetrasporus]
MPAPQDVFALPDDTPRSSETIVNIAGILVHLYGVKELTAEQAKDTTVLFHAHGRTRSYRDSEAVAHQLLYTLLEKGHTKGLVVATFDNRNHGIRKIDEVSIQSWTSGNPKHAQDMLSMVDGIAIDIQTVMTYLESYVGDLFTPTQFIASGVSLGGHVTWNLLGSDTRIQIGIPIVGCPDMTSLLIGRLGKYTSVVQVPEGTKEWPKPIEKLYASRDENISKIEGKNILVLNGALDTLVPDKFTKPWIEQYAAANDVTYVCQEENGHYLSWRMIDEITEWLAPFLN